MKKPSSSSFFRSVFFVSLLSLWLMQSACLKTRAQLKNETENEPANNSSQPAAQPNAEVQANGITSFV